MLDFWRRIAPPMCSILAGRSRSPRPKAFVGSAWLLAFALSACGRGEYQYKPPTCKEGALLLDGGCVTDTRKISVDSVGYLPSHTKLATFVDLDTYQVKRADGSVVLSGDAMGPVTADTGETNVKIVDFSQVTDSGEYYIEASGQNGAIESPHFRIASDVYDDALRALVTGLYGQRCGTAVHIDFGGKTFTHGECHLNDAYTDKLGMPSVIRPSLRGWHDAGDYGKYVTNGAFSVGLLMKAWEHFPDALTDLALPIPEHGNALPDFLAELKWELDWLLTTQLDDGSASHKVTALQFEDAIAPENDRSRRYYAPIGTAATGELAAVFAQATRVFAPVDSDYAAACLDAAQKSYAFLIAHPNQIAPDLSAFTTGGYTMDDSGPRIWAAAEIFETTGEPSALADFEKRVRARTTGRRPKGLVDADWDWGTPANLGIFTYLLSTQGGRDPVLVDQIKAQNQENADIFSLAAESEGYGRAGIGYYWGANGSVARIAMNLQIAYHLSGDHRYLETSLRQIDHLFGRNYYARSQVTGVGDKPPLYPHHRPSMTTGSAWPGLLVGGGNPGPTDWVDVQGMYEQNEVALNWNAALIYALAGFASGTHEGTGFYVAPSDMGDAGVDVEPPAIEAEAGGASDATDDVSQSDADFTAFDAADALRPDPDAVTDSSDDAASGD